MDKNTRREIVRGFYPGTRWAARVEAMSDEQVYAIYMAKIEKVREHGATEMQLRLKAERR
jgi:hypothetical protein